MTYYPLSVALGDKAGETFAELSLCAVEIRDFGDVQIVDKILTYEPLGIVVKFHRLLAPERRDIVAPLEQTLDIALIGQTHEPHEVVEKHPAHTRGVDRPQGRIDIARSYMCRGHGILTVHWQAWAQIVGHRGVIEPRHLYWTAARTYGRKYGRGVIAHEDEYGVGIRLLDEFEQLVGRLFVHLFGQPHHHDFVARGRGRHREPTLQMCTLVDVDYRLGVLLVKHCRPAVKIHIRICWQEVAEIVDIVARHRLLQFLGLDHGIDIQRVDMAHRLVGQTCTTCAARLTVGCRMFAMKILCKRACEHKLTRPGRPVKQQGVWHTPVGHHVAQLTLDIFMWGDVAEFHIANVRI